METVLTWLMALFESPESILCLVYFFIRLIYWLCTRKNNKANQADAKLAQAEIQSIYIATAQLYELIKQNKEKKENEKT